MEQNLSEEKEIDLVALFMALWSRMYLIVMSVIAGASVAIFISVTLLTPKYQSDTSIYVLNKQAGNALTYSDLQTGSQITKDYTELIKSRTVMEAVIDKLSLNEKYSDMSGINYRSLASMVTVSNKSDTRIIFITITDTDPFRARNIANAVRDAAAEHIKKVTDTEAVTVVDYAGIPMSPIGPNIKKNALMGSVFGFILSCAIIVLLHLTNDTIKTPDDVQKYLAVSVLGVIPFNDDFVEKKRRRKIKKKQQYY